MSAMDQERVIRSEVDREPRISTFGSRKSWRAFQGRKLAVVLSASWVVGVLLLSITADWLPIREMILPIGPSNQPPHWGRELLGLDVVGRSMVSRLIYGARTSYLIAICATALALCVGCTIGLLAVYFRGAVNFLANLLSTVLLSIPGLLMLLTIAVIVKPSYVSVIGSIALLKLPDFIRVIQGIGRSEIEKSYIVAARGMGASASRIIVRELLPSTLVSVITYAGVVLPHVMLAEGALSYLGYGVPSPASSWGQMIAQGQPDIATAPWQVVIPAIIFAINILSLYTLADWLRAKVDLKGEDRAI